MSGLARDALRSAAILAAFAAVGSLLLAATHRGTAERIAANERAALIRQLTELLPPSDYDNELLADTLHVELPDAISAPGPDLIYRARRNGGPVAVILPVRAPNGYNGAIDMLVGIRTDGTLAAVRVVNHRETPGLGDGIDRERSDWIEQFAGRALGRPAPRRWKVRKDGGDFDQMTGATITPRAVVAAVRQALAYHADEGASLYRQDTP